jgi:hypothetical protein
MGNFGEFWSVHGAPAFARTISSSTSCVVLRVCRHQSAARGEGSAELLEKHAKKFCKGRFCFGARCVFLIKKAQRATYVRSAGSASHVIPEGSYAT